tara:strand:- start:1425 stop:1841 length:417 start_codon:yes stop_codon:yes gene_type:complete
MGPWWLHILIFAFGYLTCKTFYFMRSTRLSVSLMKVSAVLYLSLLMKAIEHMSYAREMVLEYMIYTERQAFEISSFEMRFENEMRLFKDRSISAFLSCHPKFFRSMVEFDDWEGAMSFLMENRATALYFWGDQYDRKN